MIPGDGPCAPLLVNPLVVNTSLVVGLPVIVPCVTLAAVKPLVELVVLLGALMLGVAPPLLVAAPPVVAPPLVVVPPLDPPPVEAPPDEVLPDVPPVDMPLIGAPPEVPADPLDPDAAWVEVVAGAACFPADAEGALLPVDLITMAPNCSGVLSRLSISIGNWINWFWGAGG
jgi:hypothetical protein